MINPEVAIPLGVAVATPVAVLYRWFQHRERMARIAADHGRAPDADARLARLEQAVDAIAVEVERVGEGQRFLTGLLARPNAAGSEPPPRGDGGGRTFGRLNTPH